MLIVVLPFRISIVYIMYDKFTISEIIHMTLCRLLVHVLVLERMGSIFFSVFCINQMGFVILCLEICGHTQLQCIYLGECILSLRDANKLPLCTHNPYIHVWVAHCPGFV